MTTPRQFPEPDSSAERLLNAIKADPGVTTNGLIRKTGINPGPIRTYLQRLIDRGLVEDRMDEREYHHYFAKGESPRVEIDSIYVDTPRPADEFPTFEGQRETA